MISEATGFVLITGAVLMVFAGIMRALKIFFRVDIGPRGVVAIGLALFFVGSIAACAQFDSTKQRERLDWRAR